MNGSLKLTPITILRVCFFIYGEVNKLYKEWLYCEKWADVLLSSYFIRMKFHGWNLLAYMQIQACGTRKDKEAYMIIIY